MPKSSKKSIVKRLLLAIESLVTANMFLQVVAITNAILLNH